MKSLFWCKEFGNPCVVITMLVFHEVLGDLPQEAREATGRLTILLPTDAREREGDASEGVLERLLPALRLSGARDPSCSLYHLV